MAEHSGSLRVIIAAIAGNVAIAICKFGAALVTGSAALYSEAIHSTVDTGHRGEKGATRRKVGSSAGSVWLP